MNYLLHRQKFTNSEVKLPNGLTDLMGDISREVLRAQPPTDELLPFIANYLEALLQTRDKMLITKKTLCDIVCKATNISDLLKMDGITLDQANEAVNILKKNFYQLFDEKRRGKFTDPNVQEMQEAEIVAELVQKCEFTKTQIFLMKPVIQEAFKTFLDEYFRALRGMSLKLDTISPIIKFTMEKYFQDVPSVEVIQQAATTIQAAFRGHRVRKLLKDTVLNMEAGTIHLNDSEFKKFELFVRNLESNEYLKINRAATVIQRAWKSKIKTTDKKDLKKTVSSDVLREVLHETIRYDDYVYSVGENIPGAMDVLHKGYANYKQRSTDAEECEDEDDRNVKYAVLVIQKAFRNFLSRRRLSGGGQPPNELYTELQCPMSDKYTDETEKSYDISDDDEDDADDDEDDDDSEELILYTN